MKKMIKGSSHPLVGFAPTSTLAKLAIIVAVMYFVTKLSLGWSLQETAKLTNYAFGIEYGMTAAWSIQLLPQVLLILRVMIEDPLWRKFLLFAALGVNAVDAVTNVSAYLSTEHFYAGADPRMELVGDVIGLLGAIAITWSEELMSFLIGVSLHLLAVLLAGAGYRPPSWMTIGETYARAGAFDFGSGFSNRNTPRPTSSTAPVQRPSSTAQAPTMTQEQVPAPRFKSPQRTAKRTRHR